MSDSKPRLPPPPGIYVPAVLFFKEDEEIDEDAIRTHVLRLAQVLKSDIRTRATNPIFVGIGHWHPCPRIKRGGTTPLPRGAQTRHTPHADHPRCPRFPACPCGRWNRRAIYARDQATQSRCERGGCHPRPRPYTIHLENGDD